MEDTQTTMVAEAAEHIDADGVPIRLGSVLRQVDDGDTGIVIRFAARGDSMRDPLEQAGDMSVQISPGNLRVTNQYLLWRHVPREQQSYAQRLKSWLMEPYDHDEFRGVSRDEALAVDGIMALLPDVAVYAEHNGPQVDSLKDALQALAWHLDSLHAQIPRA